jgi:hypothetical protein
MSDLRIMLCAIPGNIALFFNKRTVPFIKETFSERTLERVVRIVCCLPVSAFYGCLSIYRALRRWQKKDRSFTRSIPWTIIGLLHVLLGFFNSAFAVVRISIIGIDEPFKFSGAVAWFNLSWEASSVILWLSGIGILRAKRWGFVVGSLWALSAIVFHIGALFMRKYYWGEFAKPMAWVEYIIIYYSIGIIGYTVYLFVRKQK